MSCPAFGAGQEWNGGRESAGGKINTGGSSRNRPQGGGSTMDQMNNGMTQLEALKRTLFDKDALDAQNVKVFPGLTREASPEQMAEQMNNAIAQLVAGDFEDITDETDD